MKAFHNDKEIKKKYLARVAAHAKADEIVQGATGQNGKGCAVWCTLNDYNHASYEKELGIPEWLAQVEDTLFEGMPREDSKKWPGKFLRAINPGADLGKVKTPFLIAILKNSLKSLDKTQYDEEKFPEVAAVIVKTRAAVEEMVFCHRKGLNLSAAQSAAWSVAWSVASAARPAFYLKLSKELLRLLKECK
jgi:hypothetical protein